jgi:hypothetical protein
MANEAKKIGRPAIPDATWEAVLERLEDGAYVSVACAEMGVSVASFRAATKRNPDWYSRAEEATKAKAEIAAESVGLLAAEGVQAWRTGREDSGLLGMAIKAKQWEAEKLDADRYGSKNKVDMVATTTSTTKLDLSALSIAQLEALAAIGLNPYGDLEHGQAQP